MPTEAQIAANRRNALKSTGPRTAAGKAVSSMNALKSGLHAKSVVIRSEDPADLDALAAEYHAEFRPATPRERDLVDTLVYNQWLIRRLRISEAQIYSYHYIGRDDDFIEGSDYHLTLRDHALGDGFSNLEKQLVRLQSRVSAVERSSRQALKELRDLRKAAAPPTEAGEAGEIGFVPSTSPQPAPPAPDPQSSTPNPQSPSRIGFVPSASPQPTPRASSPNPEPRTPNPRTPEPRSPLASFRRNHPTRATSPGPQSPVLPSV